MTLSLDSVKADPIPACAGVGLRSPHFEFFAKGGAQTGWLEAHSENYFGDGGPPLAWLEQCRGHYPLSLHGVGLSLGSSDPLDVTHLSKLKALVRRFEPGLISEHLSWGSINGVHHNDLLPLPYTEEALDNFCNHVQATQEFIGRQLLIENPSSYLRYRHSTISEPEFLLEICRRTGCGLLLDVNNVYVSSVNHGWDAVAYLRSIPTELVGEIHLAGHAEKRFPQGRILIDDHGDRVSSQVWALYRKAIQRFAAVPTLIEWDSNIPEPEVLLDEARKADNILGKTHALVA